VHRAEEYIPKGLGFGLAFSGFMRGMLQIPL
jgi:hypothetical protein